MDQGLLTLTHDIARISALRSAERDALWSVYRGHFDADRTAFDASLARADHVIRFRERRTRRVRGLVAWALRPAEHDGRRFFWLWAGALAIDRECRGKWLLERSGLEVLARFRARHPIAPLFWIYESNSFQSYRMMARSFTTFWPNATRETPAWERGVIEQLARTHYPERWDPAHRVLRPTGKKHVRPESSSTSANESDPVRAFYRVINPDAALGASVVLMAPLDWANTGALCSRIAAGLSRPRR